MYLRIIYFPDSVALPCYPPSCTTVNRYYYNRTILVARCEEVELPAGRSVGVVGLCRDRSTNRELSRGGGTVQGYVNQQGAQWGGGTVQGYVNQQGDQ